MGWRILQLTKPCSLSVKNGQLYYQSDDFDTTIPIEDLSVVIFETPFVQLTGHVLSSFAEHGIVLLSCDKSRLPSGAFFPYHDNSRYSEIAHIQVSAGEPLKKRLWQSVVQQKILNQADVLSIFNKENVCALKEISKRVQSGDPDNREGYAAQVYWHSLFNNFVRRDDACIINKALNYGYAIIRGCVARNIVASGLLPCFGIHHDNQLNQFNLVDDMMEPFRPIIDRMVAQIDWTGYTELNPENKNRLASVLILNCNVNGEELSVLKAIEVMAASLTKAFIHKDYKLLKLPYISWNIVSGQDGE